MALYADCEDVDGYHRDGCVFKEDIDIYDTMSAVVKYSNGAQHELLVECFYAVSKVTGWPSTAKREDWKFATMNGNPGQSNNKRRCI